MSTADDLKRAYSLIKKDQPEDAQAIIRPILAREPENVHAWWLLAYSVDDPGEVRQALNQVLALDPNYKNAPKAREMLAQLDEQFPDDTGFAAESAFGQPDTFADMPFGSPEAAQMLQTYDGTFDDAAVEAVGDDFFASDDIFADLDSGEDEGATAAPARTVSADEIRSILEPEAVMDNETRAALDEKTARRRGRGGRILRLFLILLTIPLLIIAILFIAFPGGDKEEKDPGDLKLVETQNETVNTALLSTGSELRLANLGESQVIIAQSDLGDTLFVEVCSRPGPDLPQVIIQSMEIAAKQAPALQGQLAAVGVSIRLCGGEQSDTLYRAFVSVDDAIRYVNGEMGEGPAAQATFQQLWKTS
jgi:hypothetical protein